jgi:hypothetical protein
MDTGLRCDEDKKSLGEYLDDDTMKATEGCVDGWQYYLVHPAGGAKG